MITRSKGVGPGGPGDIVASKGVHLGNDEVMNYRWLVECKHRSGKDATINPGDLPNIPNSVKSHECAGFFLITDGRLSSGCEAILNGLKDQGEIRITYWDRRILIDKLNSRRNIKQKYGLEPEVPVVKGEPVVPKNLFKFLDSYREVDRGIFFGRDAEIQKLVESTYRHAVTIVFGESGVGKSSILNAGVTPVMRNDGALVAVVRCLDSPTRKLKEEITRQLEGELESDEDKTRLRNTESLGALLAQAEEILEQKSLRLLVIVDQLEELFTLCSKEEAKQLGISLGQLAYYPVTQNRLAFMLSLREDFLGSVRSWARSSGVDPPIRWESVFSIQKVSTEKTREIISRSLEACGISSDEQVVSDIVRDLKEVGKEEEIGATVYPPFLQIVCGTLVDQTIRDSTSNDELSLSAYTKLGGSQKIISDYFKENLWKGLTEEERTLGRKVLVSLLGPEGIKEPRRLHEISEEVQEGEESTDKILRKLVERRVVRRLSDENEGEILYEIIHDFFGKSFYQELSESEREERKALSMWNAAMHEWKSYGIVLDEKKLEVLWPYHGQMPLTP